LMWANLDPTDFVDPEVKAAIKTANQVAQGVPGAVGRMSKELKKAQWDKSIAKIKVAFRHVFDTAGIVVEDIKQMTLKQIAKEIILHKISAKKYAIRHPEVATCINEASRVIFGGRYAIQAVHRRIEKANDMLAVRRAMIQALLEFGWANSPDDKKIRHLSARAAAERVVWFVGNHRFLIQKWESSNPDKVVLAAVKGCDKVFDPRLGRSTIANLNKVVASADRAACARGMRKTLQAVGVFLAAGAKPEYAARRLLQTEQTRGGRELVQKITRVDPVAEEAVRYAAGVAQGSKHSMEMFSDIMSNSQRAERARDPNHISKSLRRVKKWKEYMKEHHIAVDDVQQGGGWVRVIQKVNGKMLVNVGEEVFNDLFQSQSDFFIRYDVDDKPYAIYHRIKNPASFRPYKYMMNTWSSQGNKLHIDFELYSSMKAAEKNVGKWKFCNYNDPGVGFPRDCGPSGHVGGHWASVKSHGKKNWAMYIHAPQLVYHRKRSL